MSNIEFIKILDRAKRHAELKDFPDTAKALDKLILELLQREIRPATAVVSD